MKKEETQLIQQKLFKYEKEPKTRVINVKVDNLRKQGYNNLLKWL